MSNLNPDDKVHNQTNKFRNQTNKFMQTTSSMHEDLLILLLICGKCKYCMSLPLSQEIFKTFSLVFDDLTNNKVVFGDKACLPSMVVKSACLALQFLTTDISVLKLHGKNLEINLTAWLAWKKLSYFKLKKISVIRF